MVESYIGERERERERNLPKKNCIIFVVNQHDFKICYGSYPLGCLGIVPVTSWNISRDNFQNGVIDGEWNLKVFFPRDTTLHI
jgi:hypothetical protein